MVSAALSLRSIHTCVRWLVVWTALLHHCCLWYAFVGPIITGEGYVRGKQTTGPRQPVSTSSSHFTTAIYFWRVETVSMGSPPIVLPSSLWPYVSGLAGVQTVVTYLLTIYSLSLASSAACVVLSYLEFGGNSSDSRRKRCAAVVYAVDATLSAVRSALLHVLLDKRTFSIFYAMGTSQNVSPEEPDSLFGYFSLSCASRVCIAVSAMFSASTIVEAVLAFFFDALRRRGTVAESCGELGMEVEATVKSQPVCIQVFIRPAMGEVGERFV